MSTVSSFSGVIPPLTTPFQQSGELDPDALAAEIDWMIDSGVHGVVVGGSTGEGYTLSPDELTSTVATAVKAARGRVPVLASIIADSTRGVMKIAGLLAGQDIAALQIPPPHYIFRPSDDDLVGFYRVVAEATGRPIVIYNVIPWVNISPDLAVRIMDAAPLVVAIKQSDKDFGIYAQMVRLLGAERVFAAIDGGLMSCYELGARGSIAAIASAAPRASVDLWNAVAAGNLTEARRLHSPLLDLWQTLAGPNLPARVKAAQTLAGLAQTYPRAPMSAANQVEIAAIERCLSAFS